MILQGVPNKSNVSSLMVYVRYACFPQRYTDIMEQQTPLTNQLDLHSILLQSCRIGCNFAERNITDYETGFP
jgi:hypothetical protein